MEFQVSVECPRCDEESYECVEFGDEIWAPDGGGGSTWTKARCYHCDKDFWFQASISIDLDVEMACERKPKGLK